MNKKNQLEPINAPVLTGTLTFKRDYFKTGTVE